LTTPLTGMRITNGTPLVYEVITVANPVFQDRLYHMPVPYDEILKNTSLIQNEGW
jgi:starch-binding outer membrane protein, SusD/RagB family